MNIAIIIGVPEYINLAALPACHGDILAIRMLLEANGKYSSIYDNIGKYNSKEIKVLLREIADLHSEQDVDELLFYFSGHGTIDNEFIYCCKDFEESSPRITSIRNAEIDTILRSLSAKTTVKIIDACHSGMKIIKDVDSFAKSLQNPGFSNFMQFASSMEDQVSFAGDKISIFTEHFIKAACFNTTSKILYIDIENYLIDIFDGNNQTPYFVAQRTGREVFCEIGSNLDDVLPKILTKLNSEPKTTNSKEFIRLRLSQIKSRYVDIEFAISKMIETENALCNLSLEETGRDFYKISVTKTENYSSIPNLRSIAQDLATTRKNRPDNRPLVKIDYEEKLVEIHNPFASLMNLTKSNNSKVGEPQKQLVSYPFRILAILNLPFGWLQLTASPDIKSLPPQTIALVFVPFRTTCRVYVTRFNYEMVGWDEYARSGQLEWQFLEATWADLPDTVLNFATILEFPGFVEKSITQYAETALLEAASSETALQD